MRAVDVEVVTYAPTVFAHCQHCELTFGHVGIGQRLRREQAQESLPEELRHEYAIVSQWIHDLRERFGSGLRIRVIDVASILGVWKSYRYGLRRYPAVIIQRERQFLGAGELDEARRVIQRYVTAPRN
jgi:hypothetical protein